MNVEIHEDSISAGAAAGKLIADVARNTVSPVLGLATGSSPKPAYEELISQVRRGELDLTNARAFTLDEYVGLAVDDPRQYRQVIREDFTILAGIDDGSLFSPDPHAADLDAEALRYDSAVVNTGIDVQILGLGSNGHIAFNEPGSSIHSVTRIVALENQTRKDNARFFTVPDDVPRRAISQGIATIKRAHRIVMIATGPQKSSALKALLEGEIDPAWPATALRGHPNLTIFADRPAAGARRYAVR